MEMSTNTDSENTDITESVKQERKADEENHIQIDKEESNKKKSGILKFTGLFIITFVIMSFAISMYPGYEVSIIEIVVCSLILSFSWYMAFLSEHKYEYRRIIDVIRRYAIFIGAILIIGGVLISIIACLIGVKVTVK